MNNKKPNDDILIKWNNRYSKAEYAYGENPNDHLKSQIKNLPVGEILFPAEGEGRNAVYAAKLGWDVTAFDMSKEGKKKAMQLAEKNKVTIDYKVGKLENLEFKKEEFDAIALIYAHFAAEVKSQYHKELDKYLKVGGTIIFEAFSKNHIAYQAINKKVGGPNSIAVLFSKEELKADFPNYDIIELEEREIELNDGLYHIGKASVIRFVGRKKTKNL